MRLLFRHVHIRDLTTNFMHYAGYPPDHINAVITHTLHFLFLLAFYLGVKLPFEVVWSRSSTPPSPSSSSSASNPPTYPLGPQAKWREAERPNGLLGVSTPGIGAVRGSESGGWARDVLGRARLS